MGILTKTCEEGGLLRGFGRRFTVDLPRQSGGIVAGAQSILDGTNVVLASAVLPIPMSVAVELRAQDLNPRTLHFEGFDHFGRPRSEDVVIPAGSAFTPNPFPSWGMTTFVYERLTRVTLSGGDLVIVGSVSGGRDEYVALGINYVSQAGRARLGLPCNVRGLKDVRYISTGHYVEEDPVVAIGDFGYVRLPRLGLGDHRLTFHFRAESIDKY